MSMYMLNSIAAQEQYKAVERCIIFQSRNLVVVYWGNKVFDRFRIRDEDRGGFSWVRKFVNPADVVKQR